MINLILAFLIGLKHSIESDHLIMVSGIKGKAKMGFNWGVGHMISILFVVIFFYLFKITLSDNLFKSFEYLVGIIIMILGISLLFKQHSHKHSHGIFFHKHPHFHFFKKGHNKSFFIGMIHGMAGSGTLIVLMSQTIPSFLGSLIFILFFGGGLILGMTLFSASLNRFLNKFPEQKINKIMGISIILYSIVYLLIL